MPDAEVQPLTVQQVQALAEAMPEPYRVGVLMQAALGLRVSELLGLQRQDVDLHRRVVHVRRQLGRDGRTMAPLKSKTSRRTIPLAEPVARALGEHIAAHGQAPDETVLLTPRGNPVTVKVYGGHFRTAVDAVEEVPAGTSPHALRHHAASVLVASGVPIKVAAALLGHADGGALLLRVYAHLQPDAYDVARRAFEAAWADSPPNVSQGVSPEGSEAVRNAL